ncbi:MAG TPA: hypothetical protein VFS59_06760 [Gemmatimonadaceae bacterium]|nr:hypothetical protein [Gemmatimonadaceae bacterium]
MASQHDVSEQQPAGRLAEAAASIAYAATFPMSCRSAPAVTRSLLAFIVLAMLLAIDVTSNTCSSSPAELRVMPVHRAWGVLQPEVEVGGGVEQIHDPAERRRPQLGAALVDPVP